MQFSTMHAIELAKGLGGLDLDYLRASSYEVFFLPRFCAPPCKHVTVESLRSAARRP